MSADIEPPIEQTAAALVSGILGDLQRLVEQQFQLSRREIEDELSRRISAAALLTLGLGALFLDAIVLCLTFAHLLHWKTSPTGTDSAWLPLWECFAVPAVAFAVIGGILVHVGRAKFRSIERPQNPVMNILQEHVSSTTHQK